MLKMRGKSLPNFLPGKFFIERGTARDYQALSSFHYVAPRPATWADIWVVRYRDPARKIARPVAVGVLSYPVPSSTGREIALGRSEFSRAENLRFANRHVRTISRVIVHPQFRALGLSTILVRVLCEKCETRYVEAMAVMGRIHPFFERAGMNRYDPIDPNRPAYFIFDRLSPSPSSRGEGRGEGRKGVGR